MNNLKQVGLALHSYYDVYKHLPSGTLPAEGLPAERRLSWLTAILPFVEQGALAKRIHEHAGWDADENRRAVAGSIPLYLCPAGAMDDDGPRNVTHYVGLSGIGVNAAELPWDHSHAGMFGYNRRITLRSITDGTSHTAAVIETSAGIGPWAAGGAATVRGVDPSVDVYIAEAGPFGVKHKTDTFFRTNPVVANTAYADGSVRTLAADIHPDVLRALATIAGGEELPGDY